MIKTLSAYLCVFLELFRCFGFGTAHAGRCAETLGIEPGAGSIHGRPAGKLSPQRLQDVLDADLFEDPSAERTLFPLEKEGAFELVLTTALLGESGTYTIAGGGALTVDEGGLTLQGDRPFALHFTEYWSGQLTLQTRAKVILRTSPGGLISPTKILTQAPLINHGLVRTLEDLAIQQVGGHPARYFHNYGALISKGHIHFMGFKTVDLKDKGHVIAGDLIIETVSGNPMNSAPPQDGDYGAVTLGGDIRFLKPEESTLWISSGGVQLNSDLAVPHLYSFLPQNPYRKKHGFTSQKAITARTALIQGFENAGTLTVHDSFGLLNAPEKFAELYNTYGFAWDAPLDASILKNTGTIRARKAFKLDEVAPPLDHTGHLILGDNSQEQIDSFYNLRLRGSGSVVIGSNFRKPHLTFLGEMGRLQSITPSHVTLTLQGVERLENPVVVAGGLDLYLKGYGAGEDSVTCQASLISGKDLTIHNDDQGRRIRFCLASSLESAHTTRILSKGGMETSPHGSIQAGGDILIGDKKCKASLVHNGNMKAGHSAELTTGEVSGSGSIASKAAIFVSGKAVDLTQMRLESQNLFLKASEKLSLPETSLHLEGLISAYGKEVDVPAPVSAARIQIQGEAQVKGSLTAKDHVDLDGKVTIEGATVKAPVIRSTADVQVERGRFEGEHILLHGPSSFLNSSIVGNVTATGSHLAFDHSSLSGGSASLTPGSLKVDHSTLGPTSLLISASSVKTTHSTFAPSEDLHLKAHSLKADHTTFSGTRALFDIRTQGWLSHNSFNAPVTEVKGGMLYSSADTFRGESLSVHPTGFLAKGSTFDSAQTVLSPSSAQLNGNRFRGRSLDIDTINLSAQGNTFSVPTAQFKAHHFSGVQNVHTGRVHAFQVTSTGDVLRSIQYVDGLYDVSQVSLSMPRAHFDVPQYLGLTHSDIFLKFGTVNADHSIISGDRVTVVSDGDFRGVSPQIYGRSGIRVGSEQGHFFAPALRAYARSGPLEIFGRQGVTLDGYVSGYNSTSTTRKSGPWWNRRKVTTYTDTPLFEGALLSGDRVTVSSTQGPVSAKGAYIQSRHARATLRSPVSIDLDAITAMEQRYKKKSLHCGGRMSRTYSGEMKARRFHMSAPEIYLEAPQVRGREPVLSAPLIHNPHGVFTQIDPEAYCHHVSYGPLKPTKENLATLAGIAAALWVAPHLTPKLSSNLFIQGAINAGVKAATFKVSHDVVIYNGNPLKVARSFFDPKSLRRMALSTVAGGLSAGVLDVLELSPTSLPGHLITNTLQAMGESAVFDQDIRRTLRQGFQFALIEASAQVWADALGDLQEKEVLGYWSHKGSHFALGAGIQLLKGGDDAQILAGGMGAMAGEMAAESLLKRGTFKRKRAGEIAKFSGAVAGYSNPNAAFESAGIAVECNALKHAAQKEARARRQRLSFYKKAFGPYIYGDYWGLLGFSDAPEEPHVRFTGRPLYVGPDGDSHWLGGRYSGIINLHPPQDSSRHYDRSPLWTYHRHGPLVVAAHGSPTSMWLDNIPMIRQYAWSLSIGPWQRNASIDSSQLATLITQSPQDQGQPIMLYSCSTGYGEQNFAQSLANEMGRSVSAFSGVVYTSPGSGRFYCVEEESDWSSSPLNSVKEGKPCVLKEFVPQRPGETPEYLFGPEYQIPLFSPFWGQRLVGQDIGWFDAICFSGKRLKDKVGNVMRSTKEFAQEAFDLSTEFIDGASNSVVGGAIVLADVGIKFVYNSVVLGSERYERYRENSPFLRGVDRRIDGLVEWGGPVLAFTGEVLRDVILASPASPGFSEFGHPLFYHEDPVAQAARQRLLSLSDRYPESYALHPVRTYHQLQAAYANNPKAFRKSVAYNMGGFLGPGALFKSFKSSTGNRRTGPSSAGQKSTFESPPPFSYSSSLPGNLSAQTVSPMRVDRNGLPTAGLPHFAETLPAARTSKVSSFRSNPPFRAFREGSERLGAQFTSLMYVDRNGFPSTGVLHFTVPSALQPDVPIPAPKLSSKTERPKKPVRKAPKFSKITSSADVIKRLKSEGWELLKANGSHKHFLHPVRQGKVTVPHPKKDLPEGTLKSIQHQSGVPLVFNGSPVGKEGKRSKAKKKKSRQSSAYRKDQPEKPFSRPMPRPRKAGQSISSKKKGSLKKSQNRGAFSLGDLEAVSEITKKIVPEGD